MPSRTRKDTVLEALRGTFRRSEVSDGSESVPLLGSQPAVEEDEEEEVVEEEVPPQQQRDRHDLKTRETGEVDALELLEKLPELLVSAVAVFTLAICSSAVLGAVSFGVAVGLSSFTGHIVPRQ